MCTDALHCGNVFDVLQTVGDDAHPGCSLTASSDVENLERVQGGSGEIYSGSDGAAGKFGDAPITVLSPELSSDDSVRKGRGQDLESSLA